MAGTRLHLEGLESRIAPSVTSVLNGGVLTITGDANHDNIRVQYNQSTNQLVVRSFVTVVAQFDLSEVNSIVIQAGPYRGDVVTVDPNITLPVFIVGGDGGDKLVGGGGPTTLQGGAGNDKLIAGPGTTLLEGNGGTNYYLDVKPTDTVIGGPQDKTFYALPVIAPAVTPVAILSTDDVQQLIDRAAAANSNDGAIIVVVNQGGQVLGVRVESGVSPLITENTSNLVFAVDGALAEARTAAFFASDGSPLTSRTVQELSQSTITQREVESNPSITDPNSTLAGPGFVAPIGIGGEFPAGVLNTPQVDLFDIQGTNRDTTVQDGVTLPARFNVDPNFIPTSIPANEELTAPDSYGYISGLEPDAKPRGIGTLPGGIPIYVNGQIVGGIGVFFPGTTGYADAENSALSAGYDPSKPDLSMEAEYMAFAAVGGAPTAGFSIGTIAGIAPVPGVSLPSGRIDLQGITLDLFGPGGQQGPATLFNFGQTLGTGNPNDGQELPVDRSGDLYQASTPVPSGWLVLPHDGVGITAAQVSQIIQNGITQAEQTRSAIRLPENSTTEMVFAVSDLEGNIVGLYRMPDATVFSIGVAVAKARNNAYYNNPDELQPSDQLQGVPAGESFSSRSFRYLAIPHYPEGASNAPPGPFSILNDGGVNLSTGMDVGAPLPASAFQSVLGYDSFNPNTNFRDPFNPLNQNGVVFFPGGVGLYNGSTLIGGLGVSGDGVDEDDVVTAAAAAGFQAPTSMRIDSILFQGIRIPYQEYDRNPEGGIISGF